MPMLTTLAFVAVASSASVSVIVTSHVGVIVGANMDMCACADWLLLLAMFVGLSISLVDCTVLGPHYDNRPALNSVNKIYTYDI